MKTFRLLHHIYLQPNISFLRRAFFSGMLVLFVVFQTMATGTLTGFVVDDELNEPLEKAVVTISGTLISVLTDQQGKFTMNLVGGDYSLEVNYPGYFKKFYNIAVSEGISTPMFIIKLKANAVGRTMQRSVTTFENARQFPQSIENFSTWQVAEQNGHQEFNELLRNVPSNTLLSNGSGYNDSEIGFRGNDPTKTSYTFNGIMLNNPETGQVGSSMLSGLTDWAGQIQVVSGQAANLQSQLSSGGLVNVLSFVPHQKAGAEVMAIYGNQGLLKTSATVHSGLSKKGLASSLQISRTSGKGLAQNTAFQQYGFFVDISKEFNHIHTLVLNLNGTIQRHNRNSADSIGAYNRYTTKFNNGWGTLNEKPLSWSTNYGRSPLISLTHIWQPRVKTHIKTQIYAQFNRSAQLKPAGSFNNQTHAGFTRDTTGLILFNKITDWNKGLEVAEMGAIRPPDSNGKFINSDNYGITTLAAIDRQNRFGLRSVLTHNFSKELNVSASLDLEDYHASHFGSVNNLLGADGYTSFSDLNRPDGFAVGNLFQSKFFPSYNPTDKTAYFYESGIQSGGFSVRINYQLSRLFWYLEGSASVQNISRTDHYNYLATDTERQTKLMLLPGGRAQTGFRIHLWEYHSIHLKTSYGSHQPLFTDLFPSGNNWKNNASNEQVFDAEFGYTIFSRKLKIEALAYRSQITNRTMVRWSNLNPGDSYGIVNGLEELHQGVELKAAYKLTKNLHIKLNGAYGDWKYAKDATAQLYGAKNQTTGTNALWIKNVKIANSPQLSLFAEAEYRWAHNFYVRLNYYRADQIYAPFSLYDFKDLTDRTDFNQWKLPAYELLGASGNYLLKVDKSLTLNLIFGAQNLLDTEYIEQSATNLNEKNPGYTTNQVYYGTGRTWVAGIKAQF